MPNLLHSPFDSDKKNGAFFGTFERRHYFYESKKRRNFMGRVEYDKEQKAYHVFDGDGRKLVTFKVWDPKGIALAAIKAEEMKDAL